MNSKSFQAGTEKQTQLSKEEIGKLFQFVRSKYVREIDAQYEIVDHLASGIEELQAENPSLSFDQALNRVYGRFPVTGFARFMEAKIKALNRYWLRRFWDYMKAYFTIPKIILTIFLTLLFYSLIQLFGKQAILITGVSLGGIIFTLVIFRMYSNYAKSKELKNYLVVQSYTNIVTTSFSIFYYTPLYFIINIVGTPFLEMLEQIAPVVAFFHPFIAPVVAFFFAFIAILGYALIMVFPQMLKEEIDTKYSHLKIADQ